MRASAVLCGAVVASVAGLSQISYAEKVSVSGHTVSNHRPVVITAPTAGLVKALQTAANASVRPGQLLLEIIPDQRGGMGLADHELQQRHLTRQLALTREQRQRAGEAYQADLAVLDQQYQQLQLQQQQADDDLKLFGAVFAIGQRQRRQSMDLRQRGAISLFASQQSERNFVDQERELGVLQARQAQLQARQPQLALQRRQLEKGYALEQMGYRLRLEQLRQDMSQLAQSATRQITTPVAGVVDHISVHNNSAVSPGQALLTVSQPGLVHSVELLVPATSHARLQTGQVVHMRYAGYPIAEFGTVMGTLSHIGKVPLGASTAAPLYRVKIQVQNTPAALHRVPAGLQVQADIVIRQQTLWRWLLEPIQQAALRV